MEPSVRAKVRVLANAPNLQPAAVDLGPGWVRVAEVVDRWVVEVGWWRVPPSRWQRRAYWRVLLVDGSCLDVYRTESGWELARQWG
ncbi:MAG: hypothetical protein HKL89_08615 [Candidatus Dormibacteraeota bacterium]|nr:hypothetical protein [Candidatus Dormibacteraeota bacterium]